LVSYFSIWTGTINGENKEAYQKVVLKK